MELKNKVQTSYSPLDGYSFMERQASYGWESMAEIGDWPYVCYMKRTHQGKIQFLEFCEHDISIFTFENKTEYKEFIDKIIKF